MAQNTGKPQTSEEKQLALKETAAKNLQIQEQFIGQSLGEMTKGGTLSATKFQQRILKNYFIETTMVLEKAEAKRKRTTYRQDPVPVIWENVNLTKFVVDAAAMCRIGLDPSQKNHVNLIPYKNNTTGLYDIGYIEGYRGLEIKATKYGLDVPDSVTVHLVYATDHFVPHFKDRSNKFDSYEFTIDNPFDRGEVIGGFYYHSYASNQEKNKLVIMSVEEILKRKPTYASPEFWGGDKDEWKNGKKTGKKVKVDGWPIEMMLKTMYRAAYNGITIDSKKVDDDFMQAKESEGTLLAAESELRAIENEHKDLVDVTPDTQEVAKSEADNVDRKTGEVVDAEFEVSGPIENALETAKKEKLDLQKAAEVEAKLVAVAKKAKKARKDAAEAAAAAEAEAAKKTEEKDASEKKKRPETQSRSSMEKSDPAANGKGTLIGAKEKNPLCVTNQCAYIDSCTDRDKAHQAVIKEHYGHLCQSDRAKITAYAKAGPPEAKTTKKDAGAQEASQAEFPIPDGSEIEHMEF